MVSEIYFTTLYKTNLLLSENQNLLIKVVLFHRKSSFGIKVPPLLVAEGQGEISLALILNLV